MTELHGRVILYSYLWRREFERGEQSGRKARPTCVMVIVRKRDGTSQTLLFPITSQAPSIQTASIEIPEIEARRVNLYMPAWVILQEFNVDDPATSYALEDAKPLGAFSRRFMNQVAIAAANAARRGVVRAVPRK